jgi:hypothetical protein
VTKTYSWKEKHTLMDIRLVISFVAVAVAMFGLYYDYRHPYPASSTASFHDILWRLNGLDLGVCHLLHQLLCPDFDLAALHDVRREKHFLPSR